MNWHYGNKAADFENNSISLNPNAFYILYRSQSV